MSVREQFLILWVFATVVIEFAVSHFSANLAIALEEFIACALPAFRAWS